MGERCVTCSSKQQARAHAAVRKGEPASRLFMIEWGYYYWEGMWSIDSMTGGYSSAFGGVGGMASSLAAFFFAAVC